jgi:Fe-S-cluster formation regulator IscX/YfhJ
MDCLSDAAPELDEKQIVFGELVDWLAGLNGLSLK